MTRKSIVFGGRLRIPADVFELDAFRRWSNSTCFPKRGRISYLNGRIEVDMNAEHISCHVSPKTCLTISLGLLVEKRNFGEVFSDGARLVNVVAGLSVEPDLIICSWDSLQSGRVQLAELDEGGGGDVDMIGSPDLVVEIVSKSSVRKDTRELRSLYYAAGISEYWLIDCRGEQIQFQLLTRGDAAFVEAPPDSDGFHRSPVLALAFRFVRQRSPIGHWRYRLEQSE
jgi:Uma2 family endonuclease